MKSRTSSFNSAVLRKDITRFFPAWGLYLVFLLVVMMGEFDSPDPQNLLKSLSGLALVNCGYALLCAALLFGDLYKSRLCYALHAMPPRRESWFLCHCLAGFLFSLIPNLVAALMLMLPLGYGECIAALFWLAGMQLEFTFFFGLAVLCALCAGNRPGLTLLYGLCNLLSVLAAWYINTLFLPRLPGVVMDFEQFSLLSPIVRILFSYNFGDLWYDLSMCRPWLYLLVTAGGGILMLVLALLLYRRRNLESAGDLLAVRPLAPVFCVIYTLTIGTLLYLFSELFVEEDSLAMLLVGLIVGYVTFQMLMKRTVKVFQPKTVLAGGALIAAFFALLGITALDPLGIAGYVPDAQQVAGVVIADAWYYNTDGSYSDYDETPGAGYFGDPADIAAITAAHQALIDEDAQDEKGDLVLVFHYQMTDGKTVQRNYRIDTDSAAGKQLRPYFSDTACVFSGFTLESLLEAVDYAVVEKTNSSAFSGEDLDALLKALWADCEAGTMAQQYGYHGDPWNEGKSVIYVTLGFDPGASSRLYFYLSIYPDAENTIAWMNEHGILEE